jgi:glycosyltransferase involved in cell wall biosynthesis
VVDVALLTGGGDRPYALGLTQSLTARGLTVDFIGSDFLDCEELRRDARVNFLNLRGDMDPRSPALTKTVRILRYYVRLLRYAMTSRAPVFHILWNNKFEVFDRTVLMTYYRALGKKLVLTVHNVNAAQRDGHDGWWNRQTLRWQYRLVDHLFVHTRLMKEQLVQGYGVRPEKITVIPFGINETVPVTDLTNAGARARLGLEDHEPVLLLFGNIAPYKGVEYLIESLPEVLREVPNVRLIIAGRPKGEEAYWSRIETRIAKLGIEDRVLRKIEYVPDADTEIYFKAADALVLPYTTIFQSGVLLLGYSFGLPAVATTVGSLGEDVVEGETGYTAEARNPKSLAAAIVRFLQGALYANRAVQRERVKRWARERYSWGGVATTIEGVYDKLFAQ